MEINHPVQIRLQRLVRGLLLGRANPESIYRKILKLGLEFKLTPEEFKAHLKDTSLPATTAYQIGRIYEDPKLARECLAGLKLSAGPCGGPLSARSETAGRTAGSGRRPGAGNIFRRSALGAEGIGLGGQQSNLGARIYARTQP